VAISGAIGDEVAEFHPHEAKRQQVAVVGIEERLAVGDQKGWIHRALGTIGVDRTDLSPEAATGAHAAKAHAAKAYRAAEALREKSAATAPNK
jgi:hypothetical protein